jgi:hypothetical protein
VPGVDRLAESPLGTFQIALFSQQRSELKNGHRHRQQRAVVKKRTCSRRRSKAAPKSHAFQWEAQADFELAGAPSLITVGGPKAQGILGGCGLSKANDNEMMGTVETDWEGLLVD